MLQNISVFTVIQTYILTPENNMILWIDTLEFIHMYHIGWSFFWVTETPDDSDLQKRYTYFSYIKAWR